MPQPSANYNQRQQCRHHRKTQQAPYRTDYDKEKVDKRGVTYSGIPSPDIKQWPIIPLVNVPYYRNINPTVSSGTSLKTETRKIHQLNSQPNLQSKYKESTPSSHDVHRWELPGNHPYFQKI